MINAIIIVDAVPAATLLEKMVEDSGKPVRIVDKCRNLPDGVLAIRKHKPQLVFLDIELPSYPGTEILRFFENEAVDFQIIFTTAYQDYAIRAFEMSAADYLLKPVDPDKLGLAIDKVATRMHHRMQDGIDILSSNLSPDGKKRLVVPVSNGFEVLHLPDIHFFRADGSYTEIHGPQTKPLVVAKNLKYFEYLLDNHPAFVRSHRSYLVNIDHVQRMIRRDGAMLLVVHKAELTVSEDKVQVLMDQLKRS